MATRGRQFLDLAREVARGSVERHWRGAHIHAYYALLLECREAQAQWGFAVPPRHLVHSTVRLRFTYTVHAELRSIGDTLDALSQSRNWASYDLRGAGPHASAAAAQQSIQKTTDMLALLDAIDADPIRRAAAIAAIRP